MLIMKKGTREALEALIELIGPTFHLDSRGKDYTDNQCIQVFNETECTLIDVCIELLFRQEGDKLYDHALEVYNRRFGGTK
jgi:hypothetical protein